MPMAERLRIAREESFEWLASLVVVGLILAVSGKIFFFQILKPGWTESPYMLGAALYLGVMNLTVVLGFCFRFWQDPRFLR